MAQYTLPEAPDGRQHSEPCAVCGYDGQYSRLKAQRNTDGEDAFLCLPCAFAHVDDKSKEYLVEEVKMTAVEGAQDFQDTGWGAEGMYCALGVYYENVERKAEKTQVAVDAWKKTGEYNDYVTGKATIEVVAPETPGLQKDWGDVDLTTEAYKDKLNDHY